MNKHIVVILIFLLSGCFSSKQVIEGTYSDSYKKNYGVAHELKLNSEGSFTYNWLIGLNQGSTTGTWEEKEGYLVLNGGTKPSELNIMVEESLQFNSDSTYIIGTDFENAPIGGAVIILNDKKEIVLDIDGRFILKKTQINKIKVNYLELNLPEYKVKSPTTNYFKVKVRMDIKPRAYFENSKAQIKGNKLIIQSNLAEDKIILERLN